MEAKVIAIEPKPALHPETGRPVTVVGVDATGDEPTLIILITDLNGMRAERVAYVDNKRG